MVWRLWLPDGESNMSKYVKDLVTKDLSSRLEGVDDALLVNVIGLDANSTVQLRKQLKAKDMRILVVKNSLAKRATEGTPLAPAFESCEGTLAVMYGGEDMVSLAKEAIKLHKDEELPAFEAKGGVMDGETLTVERVTEISKRSSRPEQLSLLAGQILGPGRTLAACLIGPGGSLASQVKSKSEE